MQENDMKLAYTRLKTKRMEELDSYKLELLSLKNEILDVSAEKNLYMHRKDVKCHEGWESKITNLFIKFKELQTAYDERNDELKPKIRTLEFDIESLNELINN